MTFIKLPHNLQTILIALCLILGVSLSCARAEEVEDTTALFSAWQEQSSSSASRAPKPLSQTAENVTVITKADIEALNAHTLSDVLETVPGLQVNQVGGPGSSASTKINSMSGFFTQVFLDGAPLNNGENYPDTGLVPARIIERIEIIKGTASSSWGRALGGVINVITKNPDSRPVGGSVSASIGTRTTTDTGAELSGSSGRMGYYLSGGYLGSDGLDPLSQRSLDSNYAYGKLTYDLPDKGKVWGTFNYSRAGRVDNYDPNLYFFQENADSHNLYATLGLSRPLTENLELELNAYYAGRERVSDSLYWPPSPWAGEYKSKARNRDGGASARLIWRGMGHLLVAGIEYEHTGYKETDLIAHSTTADRKLDRFGFYLNDTVTLGALSITPGARFDTSSHGDHFSPSLGVTLQLGDNNLLRAYAGRGYSLDLLSDNTEKIWTVQVGVESTSIPYLWLKGTLFRNEMWDVLNARNLDDTVPERRVALGAEVEARTVPVFNTSLGAGYTFTDTKHDKDDSQVYAAPRHTVQLSLRYDDTTFRGQLNGRHIFWNAVPGYGGSYGGMIWDLHLGATLFKRENKSLEVFFSGRNLFDCDQYFDELQPNTGRWFEGGVRVRF